MHRFCILAVILATSPALPGLAMSDTGPATCGPRAEVLQLLAERHGESRRQTGWITGAGIVEIYVSDSSGSWTLTLTRPMGQTCLVTSGHGALPRPTRMARAEHGA